MTATSALASTPREGPRHVVMMSGGIGSWATAERVIQQNGPDRVVLLFADTLVEDQDLYRFLDDAAEQLGAPLIRLADGRTPWQVFKEKRLIGNARIAPCSHHLKQVPCRRWLDEHTDPATTTVYVGIDWTETHRLAAIQRAYQPWKALAPLCEPPFHDKDALIRAAETAGLRPPRLYEQGFPHNNCGGACVRGGQAQWARLLQINPQRYATEEAAEQEMRDLLGKDVAILRDRTGGTTRPLTLTEFRHRLSRRSVNTDTLATDWGGCGCFTEPPPEETMTSPQHSGMDNVRHLRPAPPPSIHQPQPIKTSWTADELMALDFPEPRWAVPGILAEGVSLLAGPPKVGKSWLSLGLGLAVAAGQPAFGSIPVQAGPVLYLALEDTPRRLQSRMRKLLSGRPAPSGLTLATSCPPLPQGGDEAIAGWLERHTDARMVVLDVFAKVRGTSAPGASAYDADYAAISRVKRLADHYGVALVLVHHVRKAGADDFLVEVSGTNGLAGAADATLVLKRARGQADAVLHLTGRDVEESDHALSFRPDTGAWVILDGPADDHALSDTRAAILRFVRDHPGAKPKDIADAMPNVDADTVRRTCSRMSADGQLWRDPGGRYFPASQPLPGLSNLSDCPDTPTDQAEGAGQPSAAAVRLSDSADTSSDNWRMP